MKSTGRRKPQDWGLRYATSSQYVPLQKVDMKVNIEDVLGTINVEMHFANSTNNPIELIYEFPLSPEILLSSLVAEIGDKTVETVVKSKEDS